MNWMRKVSVEVIAEVSIRNWKYRKEMAFREETKELIFADYSENLFIYRGLDDINRPICQKTQYTAQLSSFLPGVEVQQRLHHRSIVPVLSARTEDSENGTVVIGEFPWAGESLEREVLRRAKDEQQWSEDECILLLDNIADALAYAQSQGVSHGAVSPRRIFLTESSTFRISGFLGHTAKNRPQSLAKLPTFQSPLQRRMYGDKLMGISSSDRQHDPYKSDVYSLGLTLLYLLCPYTQQSFNNCEKLSEIVHQQALSQRLRSLIVSMLKSEESLRPDPLQLKNSVREALEATVLSSTHSQLRGKDFAGLKKSLKILLHSSWTVNADVQPPQLKILSAPPALSPQRPRTCKTCSCDFSLRRGEEWRLLLLGSSQSTASKDYCSEQCWQNAIQPVRRTGKKESKSATDLSDDQTLSNLARGSSKMRVSDVFETTYHVIIDSLPLSESAVVEYTYCEERFYYDCQVHECPLDDLDSYFNRAIPLLLGMCPECQKDPVFDFTRENLVIYSGYCGRVAFVIVIGHLRRNFGKTAVVEYAGHICVPVSNALQAEIHSGHCHFCGAKAAQDWSCFFHSGNAHFICSKQCAAAYLQDNVDEEGLAICPACQVPVDPRIVNNALSRNHGYRSLIGCFSPGCCMICFFAPEHIVLPCKHGFCKACIDCLLLKRDGNDFPCLFCGVATPISYLQGLA